MKRYRSSIIGGFVLGAILLAVAGIVSFGSGAWWVERQYFVVYFNESVHGLEPGSAVKMKGVRIGRVAAINVSYSGETGGAVAEVICELDENRVVDANGNSIDLREAENLRRLVEEGLRARLNLTGITGMLFVEMDFFRRDGWEPFARDHSEFVVVPAVPSALSGISDSVAGVAKKLESVDFVAIAESMTKLLDSANSALEEARLEELVAQLHETVSSVNEILASDELKGTLAKAEKSFEDISRLAQKLESQVDPVATNLTMTTEELRKTLEEISETFSSIGNMVGPRMGLGPRFSETLESLDEAARSVQRLADYLERNPQAILRGRGDGL